MTEDIQIFNTLGRELQTFEPLEPGKVRMYVCGVTVYDDCHVGHGRVYVTFDVVRRFFEHQGYDVTYVVNFTDVDDKIIDRAREEGVAPRELSRRYTEAYFDVMDRLNVRRADVHPTVTGHVPRIIEYVQGLIKKEMAYEVEGDVFFDVEKFSDYGKLSGQDPEAMEAGSRVDVDERKQSPLDFALWKKSEDGEPSWESPWGRGRPGWHIECSVMSRTHLGDTLDIHGGGRDLIFPHHENEIAQAEALTGQQFSRYWMHNGFVTIEEEKMSKSEGNFYTLKEIFEGEGIDPRVVRYFYLTRRYRNPLNFSFDRLREARGALERLEDLLSRLKRAESWPSGGELSEVDPPDLTIQRTSFYESMREDFNTAAALGSLQSWVKDWNPVLDSWEKRETLHRTEHEAVTDARNWMETVLREIMGIPAPAEESRVETTDGEIESFLERFIKLREKARENEDYEIADRIRDDLEELGYKLEDRPKGTQWESVGE